MRAGIQTIRPLVLAVLASTVILIGNIFSPSAATAATYYAAPSGNDSNPGTSASPFKTVAKLASRLSAGDTGILKDGTYNEDYISIPGGQSGTPSNRVTLKAQNKWGATVFGTEASRCFTKIYVYASYWTIEDIYFTQSAPCPYFTAADKAIELVETGIGGIIRGIKSDNMVLAIKTLQDNSLVENCVVHGMIESHKDYNTIYRNNIISLSSGEDTGIATKGGTQNFRAYNNIIKLMGTGQFGIVLGGESCVSCVRTPGVTYEAANAVAYNNIIMSVGGGSIPFGIGMAGCQQCSFYNNTVVGAQYALRVQNNNGAANGWGFNAETIDPTFYNNILANNGTATSWREYQGTLRLDYNIFFNTPNAPSQAHPIIGDPRFVSPSTNDFHLQKGSAAIDAGVKLTQVSVDFDGVPRPQGAAYDIGACEYTGTTTLATPANLRVGSQ